MPATPTIVECKRRTRQPCQQVKKLAYCSTDEPACHCYLWNVQCLHICVLCSFTPTASAAAAITILPGQQNGIGTRVLTSCWEHAWETSEMCTGCWLEKWNETVCFKA
jgi:hypothetical protein